MRFTSFVVVALAALVTAQDAPGGQEGQDGQGGHGGQGGHHKNGTLTVEDQCGQVHKWTQLTELAANETKLNEKTENNATRNEEIKAKAAEKAPELATLTANVTLMDTCNIIFAEKEMEHSCEKIAKIEWGNKVVANETLLNEVTENNSSKAEEFKAKIASKAEELTTLSSNGTLTTFCQAWSDKSACKRMSKVQKAQAFMANTTALNEKFGGDAEKVTKFQEKVTKMSEMLATAFTNTTLLDTCQTLGITVTAATPNPDSAAVNSGDAAPDATKSAAISVKSLAGGQMLALVSAFIYALTML